MSDGASHTDPGSGIEPVSGLGVAHPPETGLEVSLLDDSEAQVLVERPVPRHLVEGRQRHGWHVTRSRPALDLVEKRPTQTSTLVVGVNADLLYMRAAVDDVDHHVAHGTIPMVHSDLRPARLRVGNKGRSGQRLRVGDVSHTDGAEAGTGGTLDDTKPLRVVRPGGTDLHGFLPVTGTPHFTPR